MITYFVRNMSDTYMCPNCGNVPETLEHFFMYCPEYDDCRSNFASVFPIEAWNLDCILHGSTRYDAKLNHIVQIEAQSSS